MKKMKRQPGGPRGRPRFRRWCGAAGLLAGLGILASGLPLGCGGRAFNARPLLADVQRFEEEALALDADSTAAAILQSAQVRRAEAAPLLGREAHEEARPILELALADARAAHALVQSTAARREADRCLRAVESSRRRLEEALRILRETEQVAGPAAWDVPEAIPDMSAATAAGLPARSMVGLQPPSGSAAQLAALWMVWRDAALAHDVGTADLENRFTDHMASAGAEKISDLERARQLYMAGRVLQELEARIQRAVAARVCGRAAEVMAHLGDARDEALLATLRLERGLQGELRTQLEDARVQAENRQNQLFNALHQLEGEYARITQEARGTIVSLSDILFDFDKATLRREAELNLVRVATILNQFPEMSVHVEGHTDNIGTPEHNMDLSQRRAQAVYEFLVTQGVDPARLSAQGFGLTRPVADNSTAEGRQRNRRVDLVIQDSP